MRLLLRFVILGVILLLMTANRPAKGADLTLHATRAGEASGLQAFQTGASAAFHLSGDLRDAPMLRWKFTIAQEGHYRVRLLARCAAKGIVPLLRTDGGEATPGALALPTAWDRLEVATLSFRPGPATLELRFKAPTAAGGRVDIQAVELVEAATAGKEAARADAARADTGWMRQAGFGIMLHWTRESAPAQGPAKTYAQAVTDLDTDALARRLHATGAGFVVFTTAHAYQDFPAPLASLEKALPGRTTPRDLIADLAASLRAQGMSLMLYHNPGTEQDADWNRLSGVADGDFARHFQLWQAIVAEAGERYGPKLAGWWFDDGATRLYPRNAPWESLHGAARTGHPRRAIGFNAWEFASVTDWQDFDCGEGLREPRGRDGLLPSSGEGIYGTSSRKGLRATACVTLEDGWLHREAGRMPTPPTWTEPALRDFLSRSRRTGLVPILNLKVTQEGLLNDTSLALVRRAARR